MKRSRTLKTIGLILVVAVIFAASAGCIQQKTSTESTPAQKADAAASKQDASASSQAEQDKDKPGWQKDTSPITFDFYINESWYSQKWESAVAKYITEKTGVTLNFIMPTGDGNEKLNTMIASNTLPDFVCSNSSQDGVKKIEASKQVYALNELADKYDPYFWKVAPKSTVKWWTRSDGNIYGYPNFSSAPEQRTPGIKEASNQTFLVKKDMYEAIGKPDMTTPEGFLNALKAAKEKFPTVNGKPLIPFGTHEFNEGGCWALNDFLQNHLAIPWSKDGKLYDRFTDPEYIKWIKTLRKANEMGLIAKDIFIDQRPQIEEKMTQGRYFSMLYQYVDAENSQLALYKNDPNSVYIAIDGPMNANHDTQTLPGGGLGGWELNYITKNCKNPERAIRFFAYWISEEGQKDFYCGKKGELWDEVDGKVQFKPEVLELSYSDTLAFYKKYGARDCYWMFYNPLVVAAWEPPYKEPIKQPREWTYGKTHDFTLESDVRPPMDTPEGIIAKKIGDKWGQVQPKLILAKSDEEFDKLMDDFIATREKLGYAKLMEFQNKQLQLNKERAGVK